MRTRWIPIAAVASTLAAPPAFPAVAGKPAAAGDCVQTTRGALYATITNDRHECEVHGNRLLLIDMGRKVPAPEGTYRNLPEGKNCFVGKGGYILSCSWR